ncbi:MULTISPECIES: uracil phosphoribosyltransferase [Lactobacillus]|jgi:uracil phosphoribosyltransferase|uniref:Uracil phosphoribosyltransferase n=1 Tax=Lactobacillus mulieris TaxID=2508708 RepID=A0AAP3GYE8_9LACO|nr:MULTISPECIES: uracil phosphoribosyltransferase [Lactobacillus]EEU21144.1 uracil phosphoribosyltransferase [Lactobacillus jensenii 27-2-CHN]EEX24021.1 uracil phosphoribosyltransferase [Lactobacillus jensenii 115-3-CHN]EFH29195.1 uracil phosphoribosyltransferase [Lactobacillus jensenii JV-V16]KAA9243486.1 uracil phosphoribosyltransferase [Lactobacillus jensenii]KAA9368483.1 uracil phosphoribosyltransferase [Lactobacillus jensenii]
MGKFTVLNHPLIQHKLTIIRKKDTGTNEFRQIVGEIGGLMVYEMTRDLPLKNVEIETPIGKTTQKELAGKKLVIVPILRAGLGMVDGVLQMIPSAKVGHIGMYRDEETLKPHEYFFKMPQDIEERDVIIVDPMLATGGSANMAIDALKKRGAKNIRLAVLVAAPEGVKNIQEAHPDVDIYAAAEDEKLMDNGYIFPGLGDAGDRLFGTK